MKAVILFTMIMLNFSFGASMAGTKAYKVWEYGAGLAFVDFQPEAVNSLRKSCQGDYQGVLDEDSLRAAQGIFGDTFRVIVYGYCIVQK